MIQRTCNRWALLAQISDSFNESKACLLWTETRLVINTGAPNHRNIHGMNHHATGKARCSEFVALSHDGVWLNPNGLE